MFINSLEFLNPSFKDSVQKSMRRALVPTPDNQQKPVEKAFAYLRVSGDSQVSGDGFPRQQKAIRDYAAENGLRIVDTFREEGITGTRETMDRPAWRDMMTALHSDGVKTVIIEKLDRLSRKLMVQEAAIAEMEKHGFKLNSVHEPDLMSDDPTRIAFRQMRGVFAQYDKSQIVLKLRGTRERKRQQTGRCEGRKPYGDREGELEVIRQIRRLRSEGAGYQTIAAKLNELGISPRSGRRWHPFTIRQILGRQATQPTK